MSNFRKNALSVLGIAALTMTASLAFMTSGSVEADKAEDETKLEDLVKVSPEIAQPTLSKDDCSFKLSMDKESYAEGESPVLTVEITNNSDKAIERSVEVMMYSRNLFEESRMPAIAVVVWESTASVSLKPGETKSVELKPDVKINAFESISFSMKHADLEVVREVGIDEEAVIED